MQIIPAKTPGVVKTLFPSFIWNIDTEYKELYLTFDDGPTPEVTEWVLRQLEAYNAKATFFCIGNNIEKHPEIFQDIVAKGHVIGNHTYNHLKGWKHKTKDYIADIIRTDDILESQVLNSKFINTNFSSRHKLFRPPYGKFKVKQSRRVQELGYKTVMWDVLSYDWDKNVSTEACLKNVISGTKKGSIIVFHDSIKASRNLRYALPKVLEYYYKKGYKFKAIEQF